MSVLDFGIKMNIRSFNFNAFNDISIQLPTKHSLITGENRVRNSVKFDCIAISAFQRSNNARILICYIMEKDIVNRLEFGSIGYMSILFIAILIGS